VVARVLGTLPSTALTRLPATVLAKVPATVLAQFPARVLAQLPAKILATLPVKVLAELPTNFRTGHRPAAGSSVAGGVSSLGGLGCDANARRRVMIRLPVADEIAVHR
jgi:hypothetical protein